jgi:hypothetical protein
VTADLRALLALYIALLAGGAVALVLPEPASGWAVLVVVVVFVAGLGLVARARPDWFALWALLVPVSVFQVLPDWVLSDLLGTLRFPDTGGPRVDDAVPLAMAGMWVAPLFVVGALARGRASVGALVSLAVFAGAELLAPLVGLWEPTGDTLRIAGVAVYVLVAEAALGWALVVAARTDGPRAGRALAVSTVYTGALVLAYFLIDAR